ncbi:heat-shock protein Hsp18 [Mycobacterium heckeshornense]|nr:HSP20 family small heat-shock protein [Mycobacterium heckeshornense]KMV23501.1 heat shock protein Hsp18 [Mycobacterium heckeshornense]MCV7033104.1 Hsp20 family protein [Mycobacterium heckeshornense]PIJ35319.1 heat-shock protein Hsp18 [Mycobacterium heckeshornense]
MTMLAFDPFLRDFDRLTQQLLGTTLGTTSRPAVMPIDAWREGDDYVVELDLPGVKPDSVDVSVEHEAVTVRAERPAVTEDRDWVVAERPHGVFSRQLFLGSGLDADKISANYTDGVLRLTIPVAEAARPRKIAVGTGNQKAINA